MMSCAQVAGMTTAGLVAMRSSCPRNPPGTQPSKPRKSTSDEYGAEVLKPGPHDVLLGRGGGTNNHSGNINFRKLVNEHKMRYLSCSKIEKPNVAREVVELWRKLDPPGRFLARKEDTTDKDGNSKKSSKQEEGNQVVWVEVPEKKAREKASQCLRERTPDVVPYIRQLREQQDQMTTQGVSMVQQQLKMQREAEAHKNSLHGMAAAAANFSRRNSLAEHNPYQNPMAPTSMPAGDFGNRRGSMPGMAMSMQQQQPQNFDRRLSAPHLSSGNAANNNNVGMAPNSSAMMGQMPGQFPNGGNMMEPGFVGSNGEMYDPAYASSMTAMQLQQHHQQMQLQQMQLQQQQQQLQMQMQQQQMHANMQQQAAQMNMRMPRNDFDQTNWNMQPINMTSGPAGLLPNHSGHGTQDLNHNGHVMNNDLSGNNQGSHIPDGPKSGGDLEPLALPTPDQSTSGNFTPTPQTQQPRKSQKEVMKALTNHDRTLKDPKQPKKKTQPKAALKVTAPSAQEKSLEASTRTGASAPAVSPEDENNPLPLNPAGEDEDDHGALTLEEYRKTLESYMVNNNITAQEPSYYSDEEELSVESFPVWPDEAGHREGTGNRPAKQSRGARAPPSVRQVNRHKSGQSMMSCKTLKSNASSLSGLSMLSDMMSMESSKDDKNRASRRFSSTASVMSELTDISHTIDELQLDDEC